MSEPLRIAMWSGPRNISTALMRSWENRPDTVVVDEPFYAHYLHAARPEGHPMAADIIARYGSDWRPVAEQLTGPLPEGISIHYQKHMAHHLLPGMEGPWMERLTHCFLIRDPGEMLLSLSKVLPEPKLADTGLETQVALFRRVRDTTGKTPPVIDSRDVLENPRGVLSELCRVVGVEFLENMLRWPAGPRDSDGIWAPHWYAAVEASTGFAPYRPRGEVLPVKLEPVLERCRPLYDELADYKLSALRAL